MHRDSSNNALRVGIATNTAKPGAKELLPRLVEAFGAEGIESVLDEGGAEMIGETGGVALGALADDVDLLVVLGGDGTILHLVHQLREKLKPLAAINTGTLGFLTCATAEDVGAFVRVIAAGDYVVSRRSVLKVEIGEGNGEVLYGLNEAAVSRREVAGIISLETRINGAFFSNYSGDGLIIATPTGSTAYSFSAGGAIVEPEAEVFLLTPICPHALANRSMVVGSGSQIEVTLLGEGKDAVLSVDGRFIQQVGPKTEVKVVRAPFDLSLIMMPGQTFYEILRQKLRWHGSNV